MPPARPDKPEVSPTVWGLWNDSLAQRLSQPHADLASQARSLEEAVARARQQEDETVLWAALNALCKICLGLKDVRRAQDLAQEALPLAEDLWGADSQEAGTVISDLIFLEGMAGRQEHAQELAARLGRILRRSLALGLNRAFSYNLTSLATFHSLLGQDQATEDLLWGLAGLAERTPGSDPDLLLFIYDNLFNFYQAKGQGDRARRAQEQAMQVMQRAGYQGAGQGTRH